MYISPLGIVIRTSHGEGAMQASHVYASKYCAVARYDDLSRPDCTTVASRGRWVIMVSKALLVSLYTVPCVRRPACPQHAIQPAV